MSRAHDHIINASLPPPDQMTPADVATPVVEPTAQESAENGLPPSNGEPAPLPGDTFGDMEPIQPAQDGFGPVESVASVQKQADAQAFVDQLQANDFHGYMATHQDTSPDERVAVLKLAATSGMPASELASNPEARKEAERLGQRADLRQALLTSPKLASFMTDATKAPVVQDDAAALSGLEWALTGRWELAGADDADPIFPGVFNPTGLHYKLKTAPAVARAFRDALAEQATTALQVSRGLGLTNAAGLDDFTADKVAHALSQTYSEKDYGADNFVSKAVIGTTKMLPYLLGRVAAGAAGASVGALATGGATAETGPGAIAGAVPGAIQGEMIAGGAWDAYENFGPLFYTLKDMPGENGSPLLTEDEARLLAGTASLGAAAFTSGMVTKYLGKAATTVLPKVPGFNKVAGSVMGSAIAKTLAASRGIGGTVARAIPGVGEVLARAEGADMAAALAPRTVKQAISDGLARVGHAAISGGMLMAVQGGANAAAVEAGKSLHGVTTDWSRPVDAAMEGFTRGIEDMWLLSLAEPGRRFMGDLGAAHLLTQDALRFQRIAESVQKSKTFERAPDVGAQFIRHALDNEAAHVYVEPEAWNTFFQGQKSPSGAPMDPERAAAEVVGDGGQAYRDAMATGGSIAIPADRYAATLIRSGQHDAGLKYDVRFRPEALSIRQAKADFEARAKAAADNPDIKADFEPIERVHADLVQKATSAGVPEEVADATAMQAALAFDRLGQHFGVNAEEMYRRTSDVRVVRGEGRPEESARPEDRPAENPLEEVPFDVPLGGESGRAVDNETRAKMRERFLAETKEPGSAMRRTYLDRNTGLLNARGDAARELDPARPVRARFGYASGKFANDQGGHETGDGALRVMAGELVGAGIHDGAKLGGDIEADVASPQQAEEIARKMEAALGEGQHVTVVTHAVGATKHERNSIFEAAKVAKDARVAAGELPHRQGAPAVFSEGLPRIDYDDAATKAGLKPNSPEAIKRFGYALKSKEAKAALREAGKRAKPLFERLKGAPAVADLPLGEAHQNAFEGLAEKQDPFDVIHFTPEGLLTDDGFALARQVAPKEFVASADARAIRAMNDAFGKEATDKIISEICRWMADIGGADIDAAHPHGDEFYAQADSKEALDAFFDDLRDVSDKVAFVHETEDGSIVVQKGVSFAHGVAKTLDIADRRNLAIAKERQSKFSEPVVFGPSEHEAARQHLDGLRDSGVVALRVADLGEPASVRETSAALEGTGANGNRELARSDLRFIAPGLNPGHNAFPPTRTEISSALNWAEGLRATNKKAARDFTTYVRDFYRGKNPSRPEPLPRALELQLASRGILDPLGFETKEDLQHRRRGGKRKLGGERGNQPEDLKRHRLMNSMTAAEFSALPYNAFKQVEPSFRLNKDGDRGYIESSPPTPDGKPRRFDIHLLANADASTFAHETAHWLGEVLGDLASSPDAPEALKADYAALLDWMGFASHDERVASVRERGLLGRTAERTDEQDARLQHLTAKEERLSYGWEQWLAEGKAPSPALAGAFNRFARWMYRIYKGVRGVQEEYRNNFGEEIGLSDDVRAIFGRLVASEDEVAAAEQRAAEAAKPFEAMMAHMTPEEQAEYQRLLAEAHQDARGRLLRQIASAQRTENAEWVKAERERVANEATAEVDAQPAFRALRFLTQGDLPETPGEVPTLLQGEGGKPMKLDRKELVRIYGKEFVAALPRGIFAGPKDTVRAMSLDEMAQGLGFYSGDVMARLLRHAGSRDAAIRERTREKMQALYGPATLEDHQALAAEAMDAVHDENQARRALLEHHALSRALHPEADARFSVVTEETLRDTAARLILTRTVGDITGGAEGIAAGYLRAERTAAKAAFDAAAKGDMAKAFAAQDVRRLNAALYREARRIRMELSRATDKLMGAAKRPWRAALGKADPVFRNAHDAVLSAVGLSKEGPPASAGPATLDALVAALGGDFTEAGFDVDAMKALLAEPKPWKQLKVDEARNVAAAVANIHHAAGAVNKIFVLDRSMTQEQFIEKTRQALAGMPEAAKVARSKELEAWYTKAQSFLKAGDAVLLNTETLIGFLTRGDTSHPLHQLFVKRYVDARNEKARLGQEILKGLVEKWEQLPKELRAIRGDEVPGAAEALPIPKRLQGQIEDNGISRSNLWQIALNMGNAGNKQRLLDGYGWTEEQVMRVLDREMSAAEWKWVQGVWESLGGLYPMIAKLEEEETGLPPGRVEPTPVHTRHGTFEGGYIPARYRSDVAADDRRAGERQEAASVADYFSPSYQRATTNKSHTKARANRYSAPVDLSWSVVPSHIGQVLHDLAFRRYVKETAGLLQNKDFQGLMRQYLGKEYAAHLEPWLKSVANAQADSIPAHLSTLGRWVGSIRNRVAVQVLGHNLPVALGDFANVPAAVMTREVSASSMARALLQCAPTNWKATRAEALAKSPELRFRSERLGRAISQQLAELNPSKKGGLGDAVRESAFVFMEMSDKLTATPIWLARHEDALRKGLSEQEAIEDADGAIRRLFPPESFAEGSALQRDRHGFGGLVMFYGFMSKMYNLQRGWAREARLDWADAEGATQKVGAVGRFVGRTLALAMATGALGEAFSGRGRDDDESWGGWIFRKVATFPFYTVPWLGGLADYAVAKIEGRRFEPSIRQTPALALAVRAARTAGELADNPTGEKTLYDLLSMLGLAANQPTRLITTTGRYWQDAAQGAAPADGPGAVIGGTLYGSHPKQPGNLLAPPRDAAQ